MRRISDRAGGWGLFALTILAESVVLTIVQVALTGKEEAAKDITKYFLSSLAFSLITFGGLLLLIIFIIGFVVPLVAESFQRRSK